MIGFLHPGKMGSAIAALVDEPTAWAGEGRSPETAARAAGAGMIDVGTLVRMAGEASTIVSICPPEAAVDMAHEVAEAGFHGLYVDANAIAPATARKISALFPRFVDGSVVGPPPVAGATARFYLSGTEAHDVAALWEGSTLAPRVVGVDPGEASAVKMGYAGFTKGLAAMVLDIHAFADAQGVTEALMDEFALSQPTFAALGLGSAQSAVPKAWRFSGEMDEIASAYADAGLPSGFWLAAADVYRRLDGFKDVDPPPPFDEIVAMIREASPIR